jgi:chromosome partitioning protein
LIVRHPGSLTINSFTAADEIIIPLQAQFFSYARFVGLVEKIKSRLNKGLKVGGVFITPMMVEKF